MEPTGPAPPVKYASIGMPKIKVHILLLYDILLDGRKTVARIQDLSSCSFTYGRTSTTGRVQPAI